MYNLGFGDYRADGKYLDGVNTNNGDVYEVFNTVLYTVQEFFQMRENDAVYVTGSDSHDAFRETCRTSCRKNCSDVCRNFNRRIRIYSSYIDRNFKDLAQNYIFFGSTKEKPFMFAQYVPYTEYHAILVLKKK